MPEELGNISLLQRPCNFACHTAAEVVAVADIAGFALGEVVERAVDIGVEKVVGIAGLHPDCCSSRRPVREMPWSTVCLGKGWDQLMVKYAARFDQGSESTRMRSTEPQVSERRGWATRAVKKNVRWDCREGGLASWQVGSYTQWSYACTSSALFFLELGNSSRPELKGQEGAWARLDTRPN